MTMTMNRLSLLCLALVHYQGAEMASVRAFPSTYGKLQSYFV